MADQLLPGALRDPDGIEEERAGTISLFDGPCPEVVISRNAKEEVDRVAAFLENAISEKVLPGEIGLFVRSPEAIARAREAAAFMTRKASRGSFVAGQTGFEPKHALYMHRF
jgi:hypothetical protein